MTSITQQPALRLVPSASPLRAGLARRISETVVRRVPVDVRLPDGSQFGTPASGQEEGAPVLQLVRPHAFFSRLADHPKIGVGEGYVAGDWRAGVGTDLAELLLPFAERLADIVPPVLARARRVVDRRIPAAQRNSPEGSRRNVSAHYDLSNDMFAAFLDETMSYSSALFDDERPWAHQDLAEAQVRKIDAILDLARVAAGSRVLEIGTGWGALAIRAAQRGARVTTLTLSEEQAALARTRVAEAEVDDLVDVRLQDYRQAEGLYDAVVSVEMIEAVGEEFWPTYFTTLDRLLAPGGIVAIQAILMSHERYLTTRASYGWIQKYIFPGGLIPSLRAIEGTTSRHTTLAVCEVNAFGRHYAETLRRWRWQFLANWSQIQGNGFGEEFRRTWEFYLAYCEAGFQSGYLEVAQIRLERGSQEMAV
ncbi:MAG: class I SAM-dependent methyltransferase [Nocardioidaceae bacterium]